MLHNAPAHSDPEVSALGRLRVLVRRKVRARARPMDDVHNCHACHILTSRKCSVCGVCVFCTTDCEQRAAKLSYARIACAEHMKRTRVPENLGASRSTT